MLSCINKGFTLASNTILIQPVRFSRKVNLKKPRPPDFAKSVVLAACKPVYRRPFDHEFPAHLKCRLPLNKFDESTKQQEENPYERILANELLDQMNTSKMIIIFHRNSTTAVEDQKVTLACKREGMDLMVKSKQTVRMAVKDTKYENILSLFISETSILLGPETRIDVLFKIFKKFKQFIILAGIVEDRFLSRSQLEEYSNISDLPTARAHLVSVLNQAGGQIVQQLTQHQSTLVSYLDQHVQIQSEAEEKVNDNTDNVSNVSTGEKDS